MKKIKLSFLSCLLSVSILFSGCYGSFGLVTSVYEWNGSVTDNKFVHSILFWGLYIIPVYPVAGFVDVVILNLIEFWTGTNPIAMKEGDKEIQYITSKGQEYKITATKNQYNIQKVNDAENAEITLKYVPEETAWYLENDGKLNKLSQLHIKNNKRMIKQFFPNGESKVVAI